MRPKISITKMKVFNSNFFRYYYNGTFTLDPKPQFHRKTHKRYIYLNIKTEKQLIYFILRKTRVDKENAGTGI